MSLAEIPKLESSARKKNSNWWGSFGISLPPHHTNLPVSEAKRALLEERWAAHRQNPDTALTLKEFKERLPKRL